MSDLPPGWVRTTLGEIAASIKNGIFVSRPGTEPLGVPILRISSVRPMRLNISDIRYSALESAALVEKDALLSTDDLLFTRYSGNPEYVGACAVVPEGIGQLTYPDKLIRVRLETGMADPRFVASAFAWEEVRAQLRSVAKTTAGQVGISGRDLRSIRIPLPPLPEQRRIVAVLEDQLSRIDAAIVAIGSAHRKAESLSGSLLEGELSKVAGTRVSVASLLRAPLMNGRSVPTHHGGFPVLRLTAVRGGRIDLMQRKEGAWTASEAALFLVRTGDFFISRGNGSLSLVGRGGLLDSDPDPVAFPDTLIRLQCDEEQILPAFLSLVWNSRAVRSQIEASARTTAGIYKINQGTIGRIRIPLPRIEDQARVVATMETSVSTLLHGKTGVDSASRRAESLRKSLLIQAFTGRLVSQDPSDESAVLFLARINSQRGAPESQHQNPARTLEGPQGPLPDRRPCCECFDPRSTPACPEAVELL